MRFSTGFVFLRKDVGDCDSISQELTLRAGLAQQVAAGHYTFLPLGTRVVRRIETIIRQEMLAAGALEIAMPIMQPAALWQESARWDVFGAEMFRVENRAGREFCLGPTHEELIVDLVRSRVKSYRQLPFNLFQFGVKFRDELRPRGGLLRAKEFYMKDAYSFDTSSAGLDKSYDIMRDAYTRVLDRVCVDTIPIAASTGEMGGGFSEEFIAPSPAGEDKYVVAADGTARKLEDVTAGDVDPESVQTGIEICHIFKLGTRYSEKMKLTFHDTDGSDKLVVMGCYGIGVSRMVSTVIEQNHDDRGIVWPWEVAPFELLLAPLRYADSTVREHADKIYAQLTDAGVDVLMDDSGGSPGAVLRGGDLIGLPYKLIIGPKSLARGELELERRSDGDVQTLPVDTAVSRYLEYRERAGLAAR